MARPPKGRSTLFRQALQEVGPAVKLTKKIEYALMGLYFLAYVRPQTFVQVRTVAEELRVPKRFLEQIFLALREKQILRSRRGSQGGYALAVPPAEVNLGLLWRALEGAIPAERPALGGAGAERFVWNAQQATWDAIEAVTLDRLLTEDIKDYLRSGTDKTMLYYI